MSPRIGFTGDVMLGRLVDDRQRSRPVDAVWGDVLDRLSALDALVINLECTLSTRGRPWTRTNRPFHFRADPARAVPALERAGVDACALANNHVLDYEEPALRDTLANLDDAGIARAGAGETLEEALDPAFVRIEGGGDSNPVDLAVVSFTDNTPEYAADEDAPGTARIEIDRDDADARERVRESVSRARERDPDLVVASLHWGPNMVTEPPAAFREFGRWLVDEGVDVIHGHSAHVFHGIEVYEGRPILYDCGDFVDDYRVDPRLRNDRSFLFELAVGVDGVPGELRLHPVEIDDCRVREADGDVAEWCRDRMRGLSSEFGTEFERDGEGLVLASGG
ncbi:CapA family protein [Halovivax sp.]|uniref:CapA family protein n=1 Tax=Halovivax sp. TaxID=1935978 RepID=UPI0025BA95A5|nr:CapA family protein [Halovivax sp.]